LLYIATQAVVCAMLVVFDPVLASGGAGKLSHFYDAVEDGGATILLAASVFTSSRLMSGKSKNIYSRRLWKCPFKFYDRHAIKNALFAFYAQRRSTKRFGRPLIR